MDLADDLDDEEAIKVLKLMELQRQTLLMYTSCGWFFDELSGIETVQVMFAESMRLEPRWEAEFRGFWDLPEDFQIEAPTPTVAASAVLSAW